MHLGGDDLTEPKRAASSDNLPTNISRVPPKDVQDNLIGEPQRIAPAARRGEVDKFNEPLVGYSLTVHRVLFI